LEVEVVLDTDVIINYLKKRPDPVATQIFHDVKEGRLAAHMTSITAFELYRGARLSPNPERRIEEVRALQGYISVLPFDEVAAYVASEACVILEKLGEPVEMRDLFIGASAKVAGFPLTTGNVTHFQKIPGLSVITPQDLLRG